jgi:hypothetical protein
MNAFDIIMLVYAQFYKPSTNYQDVLRYRWILVLKLALLIYRQIYFHALLVIVFPQ